MVDPARLRKAMRLEARRVGSGQYEVRGHWVDLYSPDVPRCDCADHLWKDQICKHMLAAMLAEGDPVVTSRASSLASRST
jgi:hypothetical protein